MLKYILENHLETNDNKEVETKPIIICYIYHQARKDVIKPHHNQCHT